MNIDSRDLERPGVAHCARRDVVRYRLGGKGSLVAARPPRRAACQQLNDELAGNRDSTPDKVEAPAAPVSTPGVETTIPHDRVA